jgi:D-alanyl-D-alanine carboxypeptidase/D-alanyl-D-alanine-endopeptidase (penicillin-binding protein 4)
MRPLTAILLLATAPLAAQTPAKPAAQAPFCTQLQTAIADSPAHWGISVTTLDNKPLCQIDAAKLFRPASNNKLFTTAAALAVLGPGHTFTTNVYGNFNPETGLVTGDLTLVGGGDPNFDSGDLPYTSTHATPPPPFAFHDLEDLATQLVAKGLKTITGDIVGDDTHFPYDPLIPTWELEDAVSSDGAPISALTIADNQLPITVTPGLAGSPAVANLDQHGVPFYTLQSEVTTSPARTKTILQIERLPGSRTIRIYGTIAADAAPYQNEIALQDPAEYAAMAFHQILLTHGIKVEGTARPQHRPVTDATSFLVQIHYPDATEQRTILGQQGPCVRSVKGTPILATHHSAQLSDDVIYTNKVSQNLHAELLLRASVLYCKDPSVANGARMVHAFLLKAGIPETDTLLYDGSGLSSHDLVAPRALTTLLTYAASQPWFSVFKASLPVGGVDGSLQNRFSGKNQPQLQGKVFAKTGSLGESRALSGYLTAASGQTLAFSIMDDNHPPTTTADRTLMDHLVELIAAAN